MDVDLHSVALHPLPPKKEVSTVLHSLTADHCIEIYCTVPANLSAPRVEVVSATAIQVSWSAPNEPNGVIISYTIFL